MRITNFNSVSFNSSLVLNMRSHRLAPLLLACCCNWAIASPSFNDFPASPYTGKQVAPRLLDKQSRQYASILRAAARRPVDFAGRYVLATWGCGASCVMGAAVDAKTGTVTWLPFKVCCWAPAIREPIEYRAESRLLVVHGNLDEAGSATNMHYYAFDGRHFALLVHP